MSCPACGEVLGPGRERCPACGALLSPPSEGSLAPLPSAVTPSARGGPARELAGMKKRERTWQDEVKDRVRSRRERRAGGAELPLFTEQPAAAEPSGESTDVVREEAPPDRDVAEPAAFREAADLEADARVEREARAEREGRIAREARAAHDRHVEHDEREPHVSEAPLFSPAEGELQDLPLRGPEPAEGDEVARVAPAPPRAEPAPSLDDEPSVEDRAVASDEEWELPSKPKEPRPVERPALPQERLQAAAIDLALLATVWTVVVYFASRAAHVSLGALRPSWPWLLGYLVFLGLVYASYFTGTTGQTLGKMVTGLRVLQASSRPPGYLRSFLRAGLGAAGIAAAGLGQLPMMFDPARRALHDRLFGTRVVKH